MKITRFLILLPCVLLLSLPYAHAADINDQGAAKLQTMFTTLLDMKKSEFEKKGKKLETEGSVTVEQGDNYYAVTLPSITYTDLKGRQAKLGMIAINASPTGSPDDWKMSMALPTPVSFVDKDGKPDMRLNIGTQRMGGIWSGKLQRFSKIVARYNNITVSNSKQSEVMSIGQLDLTTDLSESAEGKWSGPSTMEINGFSFGTPGAPAIITLNKAKTNVSLDNFQPQTADADGGIYFNLLPTAGSNISFQGMLDGLSIDSPATEKKSATAIKLKSTLFNLALNSQEGGILNGTLSLGYSDFQSPHIGMLVPANVNTKISLNKLPVDELALLADKTLTDKDQDNDSARQVAMLNLIMTLPQKLAAAGTYLTIQEAQLRNPLYGLDLSGTLKASATSSMYSTGDLNANITGLDKTIAALNNRMKAAPSRNKPKIGKWINYLTLIKGVSTKQGETNVCNLTLDETGSIKINGKDINTLMKAAKK